MPYSKLMRSKRSSARGGHFHLEQIIVLTTIGASLVN